MNKFFSMLFFAVFLIVSAQTQAQTLPAKYVYHGNSKELNPFKKKGAPAMTWEGHMAAITAGKLSYMDPIVGTSAKYLQVAADIFNSQVAAGHEFPYTGIMTPAQAQWILEQGEPVIRTIEASTLWVFGVDPLTGKPGYFLNQRMVEASMVVYTTPDGTEFYISKYGEDGNCLNLVFDLEPRTKGTTPEAPPIVIKETIIKEKIVHDTITEVVEKIKIIKEETEPTVKPEPEVVILERDRCCEPAPRVVYQDDCYGCAYAQPYQPYYEPQRNLSFGLAINVAPRPQQQVYAPASAPSVTTSVYNQVHTSNTVIIRPGQTTPPVVIDQGGPNPNTGDQGNPNPGTGDGGNPNPGPGDGGSNPGTGDRRGHTVSQPYAGTQKTVQSMKPVQMVKQNNGNYGYQQKTSQPKTSNNSQYPQQKVQQSYQKPSYQKPSYSGYKPNSNYSGQQKSSYNNYRPSSNNSGYRKPGYK